MASPWNMASRFSISGRPQPGNDPPKAAEGTGVREREQAFHAGVLFRSSPFPAEILLLAQRIFLKKIDV